MKTWVVQSLEISTTKHLPEGQDGRKKHCPTNSFNKDMIYLRVSFHLP